MFAFFLIINPYCMERKVLVNHTTCKIEKSFTTGIYEEEFYAE